MCCSLKVSVMSNTKLYAGQAQKNGKTVHVLAYQNSASSEGPNAMVLPFPTDVKMTQDNVIDTSKFKNFLNDIAKASKLISKSARRSLRLEAFGASVDCLAEVFDVGSYTVILAENVEQIPEALNRVPENKRPSISASFLSGFGELYPDQPIAICCWNGSIEAEPLLWWYEPREYGTLFVPTMDAHDGNAPRVGEMVDTDHIISVGAVGPTTGREVHYTDQLPDEVKELLPTHVYGGKLPERLENGDVFVKTARLHLDRFNAPEWTRVSDGNALTTGTLFGWS